MITPQPMRILTIAALIGGLIGGFVFAVIHQPADAYQSPSSAAAQRGLLLNNNQGAGLNAGTSGLTVSPTGNNNNNGTSMNEAFISSTNQGIGAQIGLNATNGLTSITVSNLNIKVNQPMLEAIYRAVFHRDLDTGAFVHIGKSLPTVVNDIVNSHEARRYGALMSAVKAYENAQRRPGILSEADRQMHMTRINDALAALIAWVDTLPEEGTGVSPSPSPTVSPSPSPTITASPSPSPTATVSPSPTATASPTASPTVSPTASPTVSSSPTP